MAIGTKQTLLTLALGALGALTAARALADEPAGPAPSLARLMTLEGRWVGQCQAVMGGKTYSLEYHADFHRTKDGSGLQMTEWFDSSDLGAFRGENLIGFDPITKKIRWFSVDNLGTTHEHVGDWTSPTRFSMEHRGVREGKKEVETVSMDLRGENLFVHIVATLGGKKGQELSGTFRRESMESSR